MIASKEELCELLEECAEYFFDKHDIRDGDFGPLPNTEMALWLKIEQALGRQP